MNYNGLYYYACVKIIDMEKGKMSISRRRLGGALF